MKQQKEFDLSGRTALVTGSTQGIGFEIAKTLAGHGAKVFVNGATSPQKCSEAAGMVGGVPIMANLLDYGDIDSLPEQTGEVDILVLCASVQYKRAWDEFTDDEYEAQMKCNIGSSYKLIKKYVPGMKQRGWGRIVTIGSVNQRKQHPELSIYGVTKAAQNKLIQNIAPYLAPYGITANNVSPGAIDTPRNMAVLSDPKMRARVEADIPCGYVGLPQDVSPVVLLLCSEEGRYIVGADIAVDGGLGL